MDRKKSHFLDYFFVLRPILLVPAWTMLLVGYCQAQGHLSITLMLPGKFWLAMLLYSGLMGAVYIVNQIFDVETDRLNKKLFLVAEGYVSKKAIIIEACLLFALALIVGFWRYSVLFGVIITLSGILGLLYSVPPFKFKAKPFLDMLANGLGYGLLAFAVGWLSAGRDNANLWLFSMPYVLAVSAVYLNTTIPDHSSDKATNNITTGVFLGIKATRWLALALMLGSLLLSIHFKDHLCLAASGAALPLFVMAVISGNMKWTMLSYQAGSLMLVVLSGMLFPVFIPILIATFLALKFYHKWRFGMDYPKFADRA
ncbi:MAG: UbiA family prenyltransferase [Candidatus Edwardsbacteria bacterium]|nr:UbiA family prenyltransferase [Candidatus Edwardsbacteria bacterium]